MNFIVGMIKEHEMTNLHILAEVALNKFQKQKTINPERENDLHAKNNLIRQNRFMVSRLISTTCFFAKKHNIFQRSDCIKSENLISFGNFLRKYDLKSDVYMEASNVYNKLIPEGVSYKDVYEKLVESISQLLIVELKVQMEDARFVSIIWDEVNDKYDKYIMATSIRYCDKTGVVHETFTMEYLIVISH